MLVATLWLLLHVVVAGVMGDEELSSASLQTKCPTDRDLCFEKALSGECFGNSLTAQVLKKQCPCSCAFLPQYRIQKCCRTVGQPEMKFCLPLCSYNNTAEELGSSLGVKCVSQLTTFAYCSSDHNDNTNCCKQKGVPNECLSFCRGDVPTCDIQSIFSYQPCLKSMKAIADCHVENLTREPRFDPEWTAPCEWE